MRQGLVRWRLDFTDRFGLRQTIREGHWPFQPQRFEVITIDALHLTLPAENGLATIAIQMEDETGQIRCRNYINVEVWAEPSPRQERLANGWALRFSPASFSQSSWPRLAVEPGGAKFSAQGSGWVEYKLALPAELEPSQLKSLRLRFEAGARAGMAKVDWPQQVQGLNYPQTEEKKFPSDLTIFINEVNAGTVHLPDDPADARGVLSHHDGYDPGSYGYLTNLALEPGILEAIRPTLAADRSLKVRFAILPEAEYPGGLALYGETLGGYPIEPTILLETK
jgi:hypothetical protein